MISLCGILAIGGRRWKARIAGGLAFCAGSFLTYVLMGLGLMQALRVLEGLRIVRTLLMVALSLSLFVLLALSFRDAARFRKIPVFSVMTLKLPLGALDGSAPPTERPFPRPRPWQGECNPLVCSALIIWNSYGFSVAILSNYD
ncbi:MAG: hypothetical protein ACI4R9_07270 [Kiritimatiellia bacterium]